MKRCTKCGEVKPLDQFGKHSMGKDGLRPRCKVCHNAEGREWKDANKERRREVKKTWREKNKERVREVDRAWADANRVRIRELEMVRRQKNREVLLARRRVSAAENADKLREQNRRWKEENKGRVLAQTRNRQAAKLQRTPSWVDHNLIANIYAYAKFIEELGVKCHVDHIVPLQGKLVCGLHVHNNLRVVTDFENVSKGAKMTDPFEQCELDTIGFKEWRKVHVAES